MTATRFDVLNAISTRFERGYATSTDDGVADELMTRESHEVSRQLELAQQQGSLLGTAKTPTERRATRSRTASGSSSTS